MLRIRRGSSQTRDLVQFAPSTGNPEGGIDVNFRYFGDSSRMTGILKAMNVVLDDDAAAHDNFLAIQAVLDAAATNPDIDTIKVPNATIYCDQLKLTGAHAGLTIEGGGKTVMINRAHPDGLGVFFADPAVIGYYNRVFGYQPGNANVTEVKITSEPITQIENYQEGELIYLSPQYFQQSIALSRDCQMNKIVSIDPGTNEITVTLEDALPTTLQATQATAALKAGGVDSVTLVQSYGAGYETLFPPRVQFAGGGGSGAVAKAIIGTGAIVAIDVTNGGSGYGSSEPTVTITPASGETGSGATAEAIIEGGVVVRIDITTAGADYSAPPNVVISGGSGSGATAEATIVPIGLIGKVIVTSPGSGYSSAPTVTIDPPPLVSKWVKGGRKVASVGINYIVMADPSDAGLYPVNSYVWLCTGPAYNESDGHYYRVLNTVTGAVGRVYVAEAIQPQDFIAGQTCLIRGPFVESVTLRNIVCGGFEEEFGGNWALNLQNCVNVTVENVQMLGGDGDLVPGNIGAYRSQNIRLRHCLGHLENQAAHNLSVTDSILNNYVTHSHCTDTVFSHCQISQYDGPFSALGSGTIRFTFRDCEFNMPASRIVAPEGHDLVFENCRVVKTSDDWSFDGAHIRFSHVQFDVADGGAISFSANCSGCVLENLRLSATNSVSFDSSSTGYYMNVSAEQSPPAGWHISARLLQMLERTDPSAPDADTGVVYVRDSSGKSQLCARFNTGAVQVIATEP